MTPRGIALFALLLAFAFSAHAQGSVASPVPWRVLRGDLTRAAFEHYTEVPFILPAGVKRLTIRFTYAKDQHSVIDLGLRDPQRFRGWSGGTRDRMTLSTEDATPGYLIGPLPAGRWNLILGAPNIREGVHAHYEAEVFIERAATVTELADAPIIAKPGWYRGDLHMHSGDSDGKCRAQSGAAVPCPVYRTVEAASARGLDFIALSDHNTTAHFNELRELQGAFDRMLLVPAREITTFWGHSNVFGPTDFLDFRMIGPGRDQARTWVDAVHRAGGLVSVNHAGVPSGETCMGCGWRVDNLGSGAIDMVEVVNGGTMRATGSAEGAMQGSMYWATLLNAGQHVTGIGGSDSHDADRPAKEAGAIGSPTTVVYMRELSVAGFVAGLKSGRVFIDVEGTRDRFVDVTATAGDRHASMGGTLRVRSGAPVRLTVDLKGVSSGSVELIVDGKVEPKLGVTFETGQPVTDILWQSDNHRHWIRASVRNAAGKLLLIANPVYIVPEDNSAIK